jgi:hypothetical protein
VSDSSSWQPPVDPSAGPAPQGPFSGPAIPPPSPYGAPAPAPFGAPDGAPAPGQPAGWTPPPKPGLVPLRPLAFGTLLGASFQVLRRNPRPMFGFALIITAIVSLSAGLVVGLVTVGALTRIESALDEDVDAIAAGSIALIILAGLVAVALSLVASAILQGVVSLEVARGTLGEKLRLGGLWRAARGRIGALIGWTLLLTAALVVAIVIVILIIVGLSIAGGAAGVVVGVLLGLALFGGLAVLGSWIGTRLALVPSALMIERLPLRAAITRSWTLSIGYFWRTFGTLILVAFILSFAGQIITTPVQLVFSLGGGLLNPNADEDAMLGTLLVGSLVTTVISVVIGAISAVVQSATAALIYIDLRMRKEGLDLELAHFVEARQAGATEIADPFLPRPAAS